MLGQLGDADEERLELRLLTDAAFSEEFDTVVDEVADQYVRNEFHGDERKRVEQYFLRSAERQKKLSFASELLERARSERGQKVEAARTTVRPKVPSNPGVFQGAFSFFQRAFSYWRGLSISLRSVTTFATILIVVGVVLLVRPGNRRSGPYASITLNITYSDRSSGAESKPVRIAPNEAGLRVELTLPDQIPLTDTYRVELEDAQEATRDLEVADRSAQSLIIAIPADEIAPGSYVIRLYALRPNGTEEKIRGSYLFTVE